MRHGALATAASTSAVSPEATFAITRPSMGLMQSKVWARDGLPEAAFNKDTRAWPQRGRRGHASQWEICGAAVMIEKSGGGKCGGSIAAAAQFSYHGRFPQDRLMNARPEDFTARALSREELEAFWMPFTANRQFKGNPRLLSHAKGMHFWTADGRQLLDGVAGLWCVNAGHGSARRSPRRWRVSSTASTSPSTFQMGHPLGFDLANKLKHIAPAGHDPCVLHHSGSESVGYGAEDRPAVPAFEGRSHAHAADRSRTRLSRRECGAALRWEEWSATARPGVPR